MPKTKPKHLRSIDDFCWNPDRNQQQNTKAIANAAITKRSTGIRSKERDDKNGNCLILATSDSSCEWWMERVRIGFATSRNGRFALLRVVNHHSLPRSLFVPREFSLRRWDRTAPSPSGSVCALATPFGMLFPRCSHVFSYNAKRRHWKRTKLGI